MRVSADTMENRENMIKRLNAGILNFLKRIKLRSVGATLLGAFAGLSLTSNIIPSVLAFAGITDNFSARWALGGYAVYSMMSWGVGGWAVQKTGSKTHGAIILGSVGLLSGLLFTSIGIGTEMTTLLYGSGAAMLYGAIGGMIIGDALRNPDQPAASDASHPATDKNKASLKNAPTATKQKDVARFFRFFK